MKKSVFLMGGVISVFATDCVAVDPITWGAADSFDGCYSVSCHMPDLWYVNADPAYRNCKDYTAMCVYLEGRVTGVASCRTCNPGYELTLSHGGITACSFYEDGYEDGGSVDSYQYTYCSKNCSSSNCVPDSWSALRTGYESRTNRTCSTTGANGTCNVSTQYRCAAGYYGSSTNGTSGCSLCPEWSTVYTTSTRTNKVRGTSSAGATAITECFVASGTYYDATGIFKISGSCTYKN